MKDNKNTNLTENEEQLYKGIEKYLPFLWFLILIFSFFWVVVVYRSYVWMAFSAGIIYIIARPFHRYLNKKLPSFPVLNSVIVTLSCMFGIVLPVFFLVQALIGEIAYMLSSIKNFLNVENIFNLFLKYPSLAEYFTKDDFWWTNLAQKYQSLLGEYSSYLELQNISEIFNSGTIGDASGVLFSIFSTPINLVSSFLMMLVILFFLFKDGNRFTAFFYKAMPFPDWMEKKVVGTFARSTRAVLMGNFFVAMLQGFFVGLAFWISGLGSPILWGAVGAMVAVIPIVGTSLVFIPGTLYLVFINGSLGWGIFLFSFGMTAYQSLDLLLKPKLLDKKLGLHPLFLFLSILGGISEFGIPGLLIGPLTVTLFMTIWEIAKTSDASSYYTDEESSDKN